MRRDEESSIRGEMRRVPFGRKPRPEGTKPKGKRGMQSMGGWDALPSRQAIKQAAATDARYWRMGRGSQVNTEEEEKQKIHPNVLRNQRQGAFTAF